VNKVIWLGSLWQKVNGNVFAYFCFLTIFSIVVRNTQGGDDKMYLMVQTIIGQVEGGFDSTDHTVYPVTGKKNFGIRDIGNLDDMWEWLNPGQFIGIFFPESWCAHMRSAQQMHDHSLTHLKVRWRRNRWYSARALVQPRLPFYGAGSRPREHSCIPSAAHAHVHRWHCAK
jgi:hypothetical protein